MKKDKFKKMKLQIQTLDTVDGIENCVLLLESVKLEWPEAVNISMESTQQSKTRQGGMALWLWNWMPGEFNQMMGK